MKITQISTTHKNQWQTRQLAAATVKQLDLTVTPERRQTIMGFGGCFNEIGADVLFSLTESAQKKVMSSLFDKQTCNFNFCRMPIGASDYALEWYSHNEHEGDYAMRHFSIDRDQEYLLPYIKEAQRLRKGDLRLFASPWSPPTWMKHPRAYNYGTLIWDKKNLEAYSLYLAKFIEAYAKEGITINHLHIQNEPAADQKFPSCVWTGAQMRDFIRDYAGPLFAKRKLDCELWFGTINSEDFNGYANTALRDPGARKYIKGVGYQWAGKGAIARTYAAYPDVPCLQTENECGDGTNTWKYAQYIFELMQHYFSNGAVGYTYWNMILGPGGCSTWGWKQNAMITIDPATKKVTYNPEYHVLRHLSQFVKPSAKFAPVAGINASNTIAFENPDGSIVVAMANPFDQAQVITVGSGKSACKVTLEAGSINTVLIQ